MKLLTIYLLFFSFSLQAQKQYDIVPKWKKGDVRYAKHVTSSTVFVNGEVFQKTDVTSNYSIKVLEVGEFYTVEFTQKSDQYNIDVDLAIEGQDSMQVLMNELLTTISEISNEFRFKVLVNKENGQAFELLNSDEFLELVKEGSKLVFEKIFNSANSEEFNLDEGIEQYLGENTPQMIETILNGLNYLFQCYTYVCEVDGEISEEVLMSDINALSAMADVEVPAIVTVSSVKSGKILDLSIDYEYNQDEFIEIMGGLNPDFSELRKDDVLLEEKLEVEFDMKSTWPNSFVSNVVFDLNVPSTETIVRVVDVTTVVYSKAL